MSRLIIMIESDLMQATCLQDFSILMTSFNFKTSCERSVRTIKELHRLRHTMLGKLGKL